METYIAEHSICT